MNKRAIIFATIVTFVVLALFPAGYTRWEHYDYPPCGPGSCYAVDEAVLKHFRLVGHSAPLAVAVIENTFARQTTLGMHGGPTPSVGVRYSLLEIIFILLVVWLIAYEAVDLMTRKRKNR